MYILNYVPELWTEWGQKEFPVSKNPGFNYSEFALMGFKKTFPVLLEADPGSVSDWLYYTVSGFSGRGGHSLAGGGYDDTVCLCAAAAGVELEVCSAREIKNGLRARLHRAWQSNDHATIFYTAFGFERAAAMTIIDLRDITWADPYRIIEDENEDEIEIPQEVEDWVHTLCGPSQARSVIGNRTRKRLRRKPVERALKSLFEDVL